VRFYQIDSPNPCGVASRRGAAGKWGPFNRVAPKSSRDSANGFNPPQRRIMPAIAPVQKACHIAALSGVSARREVIASHRCRRPVQGSPVIKRAGVSVSAAITRTGRDRPVQWERPNEDRRGARASCSVMSGPKKPLICNLSCYVVNIYSGRCAKDEHCADNFARVPCDQMPAALCVTGL